MPVGVIVRDLKTNKLIADLDSDGMEECPHLDPSPIGFEADGLLFLFYYLTITFFPFTILIPLDGLERFLPFTSYILAMLV